MTNPNQFQQGDIIFKKVDMIPADFAVKPAPDNVIARGEKTGHAHTLEGDQVELLLGEVEGNFGIKAPYGAKVAHNEHGTVTLPPGNYMGAPVIELDIRDEREVPAAD